jgi:Ca2+-binding EF-hand superfamily protein
MSLVNRLTAGLCLAALALAATAQTIIPKLDQQGRKGDVAREAKEKAEARFREIDANGDDKLSREEVASLGYLSENFDRLDKNKDGFLSWEEYVGHNRWPR